MIEMFNIFIHQNAIPAEIGTTLYENDSHDYLYQTCKEKLQQFDEDVEAWDLDSLYLDLFTIEKYKKYIEINFFNVELNWDVLLEELERIFPQFIWTKIAESIDSDQSTYYCEFLPIHFYEAHKIINFFMSDSLEQMGYPVSVPFSDVLTGELNKVLTDEEELEETNDEQTYETPVTEPEPHEDDEVKEVRRKSRKKVKSENTHSHQKQIKKITPVYSMKELLADNEELAINNDVAFLKESLKREKASKERMRVAKEKLEHEILTIENSMLVSGIKRFRKNKRHLVEEEDWYKTARVDLAHYDDLYKKAKFLERSWKLNQELDTISEKMTITPNQWIYERERVAKIKHNVSEIDLLSMIEQYHLIESRVKFRRGFFFSKPYAQMYNRDLEQLEKIGAFFDIIQTENHLLERLIEQQTDEQYIEQIQLNLDRSF